MESPPPLVTLNRWLVTVDPRHGERRVLVLAPPNSLDGLSPDEAVLLAAWLLAMADVAGKRDALAAFTATYHAVMAT